ncbi:MAG: tRNA-modifying protein YgfZ [Acidimicrobiaceae bacterium]|nr:tRNA-modifying protein YgfZ [Acidimicrobiaceae bacterium]
MNGQTGAMADLGTDYQLLREGVGAAWIERDVVSVHGPAAVAFLQGQTSQDVAGLAVGASAWTWVLQPQGKVEALCRVTRVAGDEVLLDTDGGWGEALVARLNRFKLRTKAEIVLVAWRCLALRGPGVGGLALDPADGLAVDAGWPDFPGIDVLGADPVLPDGATMVSAAAFEVARIEAGVPRMGAELTEKTIPAETGLVARTVSFTKGCYTGQELVARIDSRGGNVPRHLRRVVLDQLAPAGASVRVTDKLSGTLTSVAAHPNGGAVALAYLGRDVVPPVPVTISWDGGSTKGQVESLLPLA